MVAIRGDSALSRRQRHLAHARGGQIKTLPLLQVTARLLKRHLLSACSAARRKLRRGTYRRATSSSPRIVGIALTRAHSRAYNNATFDRSASSLSRFGDRPMLIRRFYSRAAEPSPQRYYLSAEQKSGHIGNPTVQQHFLPQSVGGVTGLANHV